MLREMTESFCQYRKAPTGRFYLQELDKKEPAQWRILFLPINQVQLRSLFDDQSLTLRLLIEHINQFFDH